MNEKTIDKSILLSWIQLTEKLRINTKNIVLELDLQNDDTHISFSNFALFVNWAIEKTGNSNLGLLLGEQSNIAALGVVGQVIKVSKDIKQGLEQAVKFFNLFSNVLSLNIEYDENTVSLIFDVDSSVYIQYPKACEQLLITSMLFSFKEVYFLTLKKFTPNFISLSFTPDHLSKIEKQFQCKLNTDHSKNVLNFNTSVLHQSIVYSDYELMLMLEKLACKRLKEQQKHVNLLSENVKSIIYALMDPHLPDLKTVSAHLNMSERSMQRKLQQEDTSYTKLLASVKKSLAIDFLEKNISIKETSYLLGYSEPSAFIKAFQNWYQQTPQNYRLNSKNK